MNKKNYDTSGRPREFDTDRALELASQQFSTHGYHGTSIRDLNQALGLTTGSIYKAWGDKHGLFMASLEHYIEQRTTATKSAIQDAPNGLAKIATVLKIYAELSSNTSGKVGCMVVETAIELSATYPDIAKRLAQQESSRRSQFQTWLKEAKVDGLLSKQVDIDSSTELLLALTQGMRVLGKSGASFERMLSIATQTIAMLSAEPTPE